MIFTEFNSYYRYCYCYLCYCFVRIAVIVHKSRSPLKLSSIMKGKITESLKPQLTKRPSEVGYWELNGIPGSGEYLREKNL